MEQEWELLELAGPFAAYAFHGVSRVLVYAIGTVIVLWDAVKGQKMNLRGHNGPVLGIVFTDD